MYLPIKPRLLSHVCCCHQNLDRILTRQFHSLFLFLPPEEAHDMHNIEDYNDTHVLPGILLNVTEQSIYIVISRS